MVGFRHSGTSPGGCMLIRSKSLAIVWVVMALFASKAAAQVQTGSVTGTVTDASGAVLPGATVTLSGERLLSGSETAITDGTGGDPFERLSPGAHRPTLGLQGFQVR